MASKVLVLLRASEAVQLKPVGQDLFGDRIYSVQSCFQRHPVRASRDKSRLIWLSVGQARLIWATALVWASLEEEGDAGEG